MRTPIRFPKNKQRGMALLEGLIALLIFSIGIIGLMGLQAAAIGNLTDSKLRVDASFLANQIIGHIWSERDNAAQYHYNNTAASANCDPAAPPSGVNATVCNWLQNVRIMLPDAANQLQEIAVTNVATGVNDIQVIVRWRSPRDPSGQSHSFVTTTRIGG
jgi:type IV pilus assembly protein PilV